MARFDPLGRHLVRERQRALVVGVLGAGQDQGADPIRPTQGDGDQGDGAVAEAAEVRVADLSYVE